MDKLLTIEDLVKDRQFNAQRMFEHLANPGVPISKSLKCGLTGKRLILPARGLNCLHSDCVELIELLNYALKIQKWECPLCMHALPYYQIYIDMQIKQIITKLNAKNDHSTLRVEAWEDGSWQIPQDSHIVSSVRQAQDDDRSDPISVAHFLAPAAAPEDSQLENFINKDIQPKLCVGFPWNATEVVVFDFSQNRWLRLTNYRNKLRQFSSFQTIYVGQSVYIMGGIDVNYTQMSNVYEFSSRGLNRRNSMGIPRSHFAHATIGDYIYVFGGFFEGERLSHCEKYSISNDQWAAIEPMPGERCEHIATVRQNDEIIIMGGANSSGLTSELYRYHAMDNTWVTLHVILPRPVISPYYINIPDTNLLLLIGGMERNGQGKYEASSCIQIFRSNTYNWEPNVPQLPLALSDPLVPPVYHSAESKVYIITGVEEGYHIKLDLKKLVPDLYTIQNHLANELNVSQASD